MPAEGRAGAVQRLEDLGATGADQAREADDLAGADAEVDAREDAGQLQAAHVEDGVARRGAAGRSRGGKTYSIDRPVISLISSEVGVSSTASPVATVLPSLSTVMRSPIWRISSSRWEM